MSRTRPAGLQTNSLAANRLAWERPAANVRADSTEGPALRTRTSAARGRLRPGGVRGEPREVKGLRSNGLVRSNRREACGERSCSARRGSSLTARQIRHRRPARPLRRVPEAASRVRVKLRHRPGGAGRGFYLLQAGVSRADLPRPRSRTNSPVWRRWRQTHGGRAERLSAQMSPNLRPAHSAARPAHPTHGYPSRKRLKEFQVSSFKFQFWFGLKLFNLFI